MNGKRMNILLDKMSKDKKVRIKAVRKSFLLFFLFYLGEAMTYALADFQKTMISVAQDWRVRNVVVAAFRNSAKSTILTYAFPIWAILGEQQVKYVLIVSKTQHQSQQHLVNIRNELEKNALLQDDLGPFQEERNQWNLVALNLPKYQARIEAASVGQMNIRGIKHGHRRPDLIIMDDLEDSGSAATAEGRNKVYDWIMGEVIHLGGKHTRLFFVGNLLHPDGVFLRLKKLIDTGGMNGAFFRFPILDENDNPMWPGKYPTKEDVEAERKSKGTRWDDWMREDMLIFPESDWQIIKSQSIKRDVQPPKTKEYGYRYSAIAVDLALSLKDGADYTAIVIFDVYGYGQDRRAYIRPEYINERMEPGEAIRKIVELAKTLGSGTAIYAEKANAETVVGAVLNDYGLKLETISAGLSKEIRMRTIQPRIELGKVIFPLEDRFQPAIQQLVGFGVEKHDDIADAITAGIIKIFEKEEKIPAMLAVMKEQCEARQKNPLSPGSLSGWKRWADNERGSLGLSGFF